MDATSSLIDTRIISPEIAYTHIEAFTIYINSEVLHCIIIKSALEMGDTVLSPHSNMEEAGFMADAAASHQGSS